MSTINANTIVQVNPGVVSAGGNPLSLNGLFLDQNTTIPYQSVLTFTSSAAVGAYFGLGSPEYAASLIYFAANDNKTQVPAAMLFAPFYAAAASAWARGASLANVSLTQLQAMSGSFTVTIDGSVKTAASINLSAATSFSNAATLIATALTLSGGQTVTYNSTLNAFQVTSGTTGLTSTINAPTGTLAALLLMTAATGVQLSQGAPVDTATTALNNATAVSQNWMTFTTLFEPTGATGKLPFAQWVNAQNDRYAYICWDTDPLYVQNYPQTATFGYQVDQAGYEGVVVQAVDPLAVTTGSTAAGMVSSVAYAFMGTVAAIDFSRTNGRITLMFKAQSGLLPTCTSTTTYSNIIANGGQYYGAYGTANTNFIFFADGSVSGKFKWMDTFADQTYMNSQFQLNLLTLLTSVGSIPYNSDGYAMIKLALQDTINAMLNFGAIRQGVTVSATQAATINTQAGVSIDKTLSTDGYYLQVLDPGATVRGNRGTPVINFWYMDGQAVQKLSIASIAVL